MARETGPRDRDQSNESTAVTRRRWQPVFGTASSPFTFARRMAEDMDRLFEGLGFGRAGGWTQPFFERGLWPSGESAQMTWMPQIETFRRGDQLVVRADLPGLTKENVNVEVENGILKISGERQEEKEDKSEEYYRSERSYGQFYRAIPLPEGVSEEQCNATFKDGVLEVTLPAPKETPRRGKRIDIR